MRLLLQNLHRRETSAHREARSLAGRTPLAMVRRSMQVFGLVAGKIAGIVLNDEADSLPHHFVYPYYGYEQAGPSRSSSLELEVLE